MRGHRHILSSVINPLRQVDFKKNYGLNVYESCYRWDQKLLKYECIFFILFPRENIWGLKTLQLSDPCCFFFSFFFPIHITQGLHVVSLAMNLKVSSIFLPNVLLFCVNLFIHLYLAWSVNSGSADWTTLEENEENKSGHENQENQGNNFNSLQSLLKLYLVVKSNEFIDSLFPEMTAYGTITCRIMEPYHLP